MSNLDQCASASGPACSAALIGSLKGYSAENGRISKEQLGSSLLGGSLEAIQ
jgi:hypothetical protein